MSGDETVGWFDHEGKYHVNWERYEYVRFLALGGSGVVEMIERVNLEKNGMGLYIYTEVGEHDWFS